MSIIINEPGSGTTRLEPKSIPRETFLQDYVQDHPEVLPLNEIRDEIRLFVVAKEFNTGSGPIDVLALDDRGGIYLIETKLYKNSDKRTVVAQVLDYGASLWRKYTTAAEFVEDIREATRTLTGGNSLEEKLGGSFGVDDGAVQEILEAVGENLKEGSFHFVVLMDVIDDRLKDLIAFVNENSRFSVYGVELDFYEYKGLEIVIPRIYGAEVKKDVATAQSRRRKWNQKLFFEDARNKLTEEYVDALWKLFEYCRKSSNRIDWGSGANTGSFNPKFSVVSATKSVISVMSDGRISINFGWLNEGEPCDLFVKEFGVRVQNKIGLTLPANYSEQYPEFGPELWTSKVDVLIESLDLTLKSVEENT